MVSDHSPLKHNIDTKQQRCDTILKKLLSAFSKTFCWSWVWSA